MFQLVFDQRTRRVLAMQGFGVMNDSISARIDAAAIMITNGAIIEDFMWLKWLMRHHFLQPLTLSMQRPLLQIISALVVCGKSGWIVFFLDGGFFH